MRSPADARIIELLNSRDGLATRVDLKNGAAITVYNIAWGYDGDDEFAHVTTNVSPHVDGTHVDFFFTGDIESVSDPASGAVLT